MMYFIRFLPLLTIYQEELNMDKAMMPVERLTDEEVVFEPDFASIDREAAQVDVEEVDKSVQDEERRERKRDIKRWPFDVVNKDEKLAIQISYKSETREFGPEEISVMVLTKMKETAEAYLVSRTFMYDVGIIAGLQVLRIINDPTAAAVAYGLNKQGGDSQIIVYDLGGGTFDVLHKKKTGTDHDVTTNLREVEMTRHALSSQQSTRIEIESFEDGDEFSETLTKAKLKELNMDLFRETMKPPVEQVLKDVNVKKELMRYVVVLVDGSTHIPKVQQLLKEYFNGKEPSKGVNPNEAVAHGGAVPFRVNRVPKMSFLWISIPSPSVSRPPVVSSRSLSLVTRSFPLRKSQIPLSLSRCMYDSEGEHALTKDNNLLGKFELPGIHLHPVGRLSEAALSGWLEVEELASEDEVNCSRINSQPVVFVCVQQSDLNWLKDWPRIGPCGRNRVFAPKYQQRAVIAPEFIERFHSDDARFLAAYPEVEQGYSALLRAINTACQARGEREMRSWTGIQSSS
ncbi:Hsp70 protein-domain-containing protein [Lanmaoa asiatica]|nr:Hsp70 protein-domain-containing protein [Lanmaoa asiatica]